MSNLAAVRTAPPILSYPVIMPDIPFISPSTLWFRYMADKRKNAIKAIIILTMTDPLFYIKHPHEKYRYVLSKNRPFPSYFPLRLFNNVNVDKFVEDVFYNVYGDTYKQYQKKSAKIRAQLSECDTTKKILHDQDQGSIFHLFEQFDEKDVLDIAGELALASGDRHLKDLYKYARG